MKTLVTLKGGKDFAYGLKYAKKYGGSFNPTTKTWLIPGDHTHISAFASARLVSEQPVPTMEEVYRDWSENPNSVR